MKDRVKRWLTAIGMAHSEITKHPFVVEERTTTLTNGKRSCDMAAHKASRS